MRAREFEGSETELPSVSAVELGSGAENYESPEFRVFSTSERALLPVNNLIVFSQVREERNPEISRLQQSIDSEGLINAVDVVMADKKLLLEYNEFTNRLWGDDDTALSAASVDYKGEERYPILIAGHSRVLAIRFLAERDQRTAVVEAKLHRVETTEDLLAIQLAENIYSSPPPERAARAIAEMYHWESALRPSLTKEDFMRRHGVRKDALASAIDYAKLPQDYRDVVANSEAPFSVVAAIGHNYEVWARSEMLRRFGHEEPLNLTDTQTAELEALLAEKVHYFLGYYLNQAKRRVKPTLAALSQNCAEYEGQIESIRGERISNRQNLELTLVDARGEDEARLREVTRRNLREWERSYGDDATQLYKHLSSLVGHPSQNGQRSELVDVISELRQKIGRVHFGRADISHEAVLQYVENNRIGQDSQ